MRRAKIQDSENRGQERYLFMKEEWLTEAQVRGLFGKFARLRTQKGKKATIGVDNDTLAAEHGEEEYKDEIVALRDRANTQQELSEQDHPIEVRIKSKGVSRKLSYSNFFPGQQPEHMQFGEGSEPPIPEYRYRYRPIPQGIGIGRYYKVSVADTDTGKNAISS